jgi:hypothetical protein
MSSDLVVEEMSVVRGWPSRIRYGLSILGAFGISAMGIPGIMEQSIP